MSGRIMICKRCGAEVPFEETNEHTKTHRDPAPDLLNSTRPTKAEER